VLAETVGSPTVRIALLSDGDPEGYAAWSGITRSILTQLRLDGHEVRTFNVALTRIRRAWAAAMTLSPNRDRWRAKYTLGRVSFQLRSERARQTLAAMREPECGVQIGATFNAFRRFDRPYFLCCDSNIKVAIRGRETGFSHGSVLRPGELDAVVRREAEVYQAAAGIFTLSERLRASFIEDFGIPAQRVHCTYAGPNFDQARIPPPEERPPIADRPPTILFVGAQFARKGGDVLAGAFQRVRRVVPEARLVIIGPERAPIQADGVRWLGYLRKEVPEGWNALVRAYREADVFCLPTRFEPFGIAFVEAMHFGLPCIGTATNAVPEIVRDGETGFIVPVDDEAALAERLVRLLQDLEMARRMGAAGLVRAREVFSWPAVVGVMTSAMEQSLRGGKSAA
jgi:starch synthase